MINKYENDNGEIRFNTTPTIQEVKSATWYNSPHFFERDTLKFFGQTMKSFKVKRSPENRIFVYALMYDKYAGMHRGYTFREFNGYDLLNISGMFETKQQILDYIKEK